MTHVIARFRSLATLLGLAAALAFGWPAVAETGADGTWRLSIELSSFHAGPIGGFEALVEVKDGRLAAAFDRRQTQLALDLVIAGGAVSGHLAVRPGSDWLTTTRRFRGVVADGVFEQEVDVPGLYQLHGDVDSDYDSRIVSVRLRLQRP